MQKENDSYLHFASSEFTVEEEQEAVEVLTHYFLIRKLMEMKQEMKQDKGFSDVGGLNLCYQ